MSAILKFPPAPQQLEWLRKSAEEWAAFSGEETGTRNENLIAVYRYLKWSDIYNGCDRKSPERKVAYGFVIKYYRIMRQEEPVSGEHQFIERSEQMLKESNEAIRHRKTKR